MSGHTDAVPDPRQWDWEGAPRVAAAVRTATPTWLHADEQRMWQIAERWHEIGRAARGPRADAMAAADRALAAGDGPAAEALRATWRRLAEGDQAPLNELPQLVDQLGDLVGGAAAAVEASKIERWTALADLGASVVMCELADQLTGGAGPVLASATAATRAALAAADERLTRRLEELGATSGAASAPVTAAGTAGPADRGLGDHLSLLNANGPGGDPARAANAVDATLAFFDTWARDQPRVAVERFPDSYTLGEAVFATYPDSSGLARIEQAVGASFQNLCPPVGDLAPTAAQAVVNHALANLRAHLVALGPGSFAFVVGAWEGGGAHVWAAVNHGHVVSHVDAQCGRHTAAAPLYGHYGRPYDGNLVILDALVLGVDGAAAPLPHHGEGAWSVTRRPQAEAPVAPDLDLLLRDDPELAAAVNVGSGLTAELRADDALVRLLWSVRAEVSAEISAGADHGLTPMSEAVQGGFDPGRRADRAYVRTFVERLFAQAPAARAELDRAARALASTLDGTVVAVPPLNRQQALELVTLWGGDAARLVELATARVELPDVSSLAKARASASADPTLDVVGIAERPDPGGGSESGAAQIALRTASGHVGLLRLCLTGAERAADVAEALDRARREVLGLVGGDGPSDAGAAALAGLDRLREPLLGSSGRGPGAASVPVGRRLWRGIPTLVRTGSDDVVSGWRLSSVDGGWTPLTAGQLDEVVAVRCRSLWPLERDSWIQEVETLRARLGHGDGAAATLARVAEGFRQVAAGMARPLTATERAWARALRRRTYAMRERELSAGGCPAADRDVD
ncbi:toxin glutamine deamidase domain-containing protein [Pilimelia columellifera]|uniref:Uncharacterized protein n=1 Tax=Pilimelia columellifera subsp. columellifera TaxID=706583 RepID=A0ABP6AV02_9ACTN